MNLINETILYVGAGVTHAGPFKNRFADNAGFGIAYADLLEKRTQTALEMFYHAEITPWLIFIPDLQHVINSDGNGDNTFMLGLRMQWIL